MLNAANAANHIKSLKEMYVDFIGKVIFIQMNITVL